MLRYAESHQNSLNKRLHYICVPAIMLSTLGMLASIPGPINFAWIALLIASGYYAQFKNITLVLVIWAMCAVDLLIISTFGENRFLISLGIFVLAWIGQFIGHKVEGKKPSFFEDIFFLLIGPLWIVFAAFPGIFPIIKTEGQS